MRRVVLAACLLGATLSFGVPAVGRAQVPDCSLEPAGGLVNRTLGTRRYLIHVPAGLTGPAPLVLSLHGFGATADFHARDTGWVPFADANRFIVAYPEGTGQPRHWEFGQSSLDVAFIREVVADIAATWCVDTARIHATGHSNGALMSLRLACDAADLFGSVAEYAGGPPDFAGSPCAPSRPISVGIFSSAFDMLSLLPFGWYTRDRWLAINGCPAGGVKERGVLLDARRYAPCAASTEVVWRAYLFQSHNWPYGKDGNDIRQRMWDLFRRNPLP